MGSGLAGQARAPERTPSLHTSLPKAPARKERPRQPHWLTACNPSH